MGLPLKYFKDPRSMPKDFQRIVYPKAYFSQICGLDFFQGRLLRRELFFLDPRTPHKMESVEKASHRTHKSCQTLRTCKHMFQGNCGCISCKTKLNTVKTTKVVGTLVFKFLLQPESLETIRLQQNMNLHI